MTTQPEQPSSETRYIETDIIRDPDGVIGVITERVSDGAISFGLYREFDRGGRTERSKFLARRHIPGARRILDDLEERLEQLEDRSRAKRRNDRDGVI